MTEEFLATIDSDRKTYDACMSFARSGCWTIKHPIGSLSREQAIQIYLTDAIKEYFETRLDDPAKGLDSSTGCIVATIVAAAFRLIDWREVAEHYIQKVKEEGVVVIS